MTRPRDNQRQRVYDAEHTAHALTTGRTWVQTIANGDLQDYVNSVYARGTFKRRWPRKSPPKVRLGKGGGHADYWGSTITLGVGARNEWVVLHEIAHCLTPVDAAAHGPEFAGIYLWLVEDNLGKAAAKTLREQYSKNKVRKSNAAIPAPMAREEQRLRDEVARIEKELADARRALAVYQAAQRGLAA